MRSILFFSLALALSVLAGCRKDGENRDTTGEAELLGTWVIVGDQPGRQPADSLHFFKKGDKFMLRFYSWGSPGPGWPSEAETEYRMNDGRLQYKDYSGSSQEFFTLQSFEWVEKSKLFSVRLYEVLLYMSAAYRVEYKKVS